NRGRIGGPGSRPYHCRTRARRVGGRVRPAAVGISTYWLETDDLEVVQNTRSLCTQKSADTGRRRSSCEVPVNLVVITASFGVNPCTHTDLAALGLHLLVAFGEL